MIKLVEIPKASVANKNGGTAPVWVVKRANDPHIRMAELPMRVAVRELGALILENWVWENPSGSGIKSRCGKRHLCESVALCGPESYCT